MTEAIFYNALNISFDSDYRKLEKFKRQFRSWESAWQNVSPDERKKCNAEEEWGELAKSGVRLILRDEQAYQSLLKEIPHPPFGIYVLGDLPKNDWQAFAIVGTRKATTEGKDLARKFASELADHGLTIISGLALGIDAAAHEGCLAAGGKTVAVLGNGLDYFYPRTNERLAKKILAEGGAIISEYPLGAQPLPYRFLERNRIVSGLSRGVLVIEAPTGSGSLVTARFALDQNRDVFVVPGPISHPNFLGSNQLIREGAELVTKPEEILEAWGIETDSASMSGTKLDTAEEKTIFEILSSSAKPLDANIIAEKTNMDISAVNRVLTFMVVKGALEETDRGYTAK